jgi:hypothetical protein
MKQQFGRWNLFKKAFAIITASLPSLGNHIHASDTTLAGNNPGNSNSQNFKKNVLTPKLVLKLRSTNIDESKFMMHTSHSSHSSHSSHASHASHSSHYSSSSSSSPYTPTVIPEHKTIVPDIKNKIIINHENISDSITITNELPYFLLGSRTLFLGCKGTDVKELEELLIALGYEVIVDGFFDAKTKVAVIVFQRLNHLVADGKVGPKTLMTIQKAQ